MKKRKLKKKLARMERANATLSWVLDHEDAERDRLRFALDQYKAHLLEAKEDLRLALALKNNLASAGHLLCNAIDILVGADSVCDELKCRVQDTKDTWFRAVVADGEYK